MCIRDRQKIDPRSQVSTGELPTHRVARLCAGRRLCRGEMPFFQTKRAMAMMGKTNACKKPKLEPEQPPPQSMKRCRFGYPKPAECDSLPPLEDEIKCMRPADLYEVVCQLSRPPRCGTICASCRCRRPPPLRSALPPRSFMSCTSARISRRPSGVL